MNLCEILFLMLSLGLPISLHCTPLANFYQILTNTDLPDEIHASLSMIATFTHMNSMICASKCTANKLCLMALLKNSTCSLFNQTATPAQKTPNMSSSVKMLVKMHRHCYDIFKATDGSSVDGIYTIFLSGQQPTQVYCRMTRGGYTLIQQLVDNSTIFNASWATYTNGFGVLTDNYWIGLQSINLLTNRDQMMTLLVEMKATTGPTSSVDSIEFASFRVGAASSKFLLSLGKKISGSLQEDFYSYHIFNEMKFSTFDNDNDNCDGCSCSNACNTGWWFNRCTYLLPTSKSKQYYNGTFFSYATTQMLIRPAF